MQRSHEYGKIVLEYASFSSINAITHAYHALKQQQLTAQFCIYNYIKWQWQNRMCTILRTTSKLRVKSIYNNIQEMKRLFFGDFAFFFILSSVPFLLYFFLSINYSIIFGERSRDVHIDWKDLSLCLYEPISLNFEPFVLSHIKSLQKFAEMFGNEFKS